MANGNTALKLLASESTPAIAMADQPSATPTPRGIEAELGVATAAAAVAVGQALVDFQAIGAMAPATRLTSRPPVQKPNACYASAMVQPGEQSTVRSFPRASLIPWLAGCSRSRTGWLQTNKRCSGRGQTD